MMINLGDIVRATKDRQPDVCGCRWYEKGEVGTVVGVSEDIATKQVYIEVQFKKKLVTFVDGSNRGDIPCIKIGSAFRFDPKDEQKFIEEFY